MQVFGGWMRVFAWENFLLAPGQTSPKMEMHVAYGCCSLGYRSQPIQTPRHVPFEERWIHWPLKHLFGEHLCFVDQ